MLPLLRIPRYLKRALIAATLAATAMLGSPEPRTAAAGDTGSNPYAAAAPELPAKAESQRLNLNETRHEEKAAPLHGPPSRERGTVVTGAPETPRSIDLRRVAQTPPPLPPARAPPLPR